MDDGEPRQHTGTQHGFETLLDPGNVLLGHRATDDFIFEYEPSGRRHRFGNDLDAGELARPARLLLLRMINRGRFGDLLAVGHLRRADVGIPFLAALSDVDFYVDMELPHTFANCLARL